MRLIIVSHSVQDFSPTTVQSGSLAGPAVFEALCFEFTAIQDSIADGGETFVVALQSTDAPVTNGRVTITIRDLPTPSPTPTPPGDDVEGTYIQ